MPGIFGAGDFRFEALPHWGDLPPEIELGDVAGVAVDAKDRVYLFNRGAHPLVVLDRGGAFKTSWGHGLFANAHGAHIGADQCLYLTDNGHHTVRKFTLEGKLLLTLGVEGRPSAFMSGAPFCRCTHTALAPNGDIYVSDGYHNACVHKYAPDGRHLKTWGGPGSGPGEFNLPHNICCDAHGLVYVADRENHRVQIFSADGGYVAEVRNMHRPSGLAITPGADPRCIVGELAPYMEVNRMTPNLGPRVSVLDIRGKLLSRIDGGAGLGPGQFVSPHSIALDSHGDMYVGEVAATDWEKVFPGKPRPERLGRFQKFRRVA